MMAEGTGPYQRSAYIPDQTRLTVSPSPVKYLLARNFEQLNGIRAGETDEILRTLIRDLNSFLSQHTPWTLPSEIPQTGTWTFEHQEFNSDDSDILFISVRPEKHNQEEQPFIIVHKDNLIRGMVDPDYDPEVDDYTSAYWHAHGRAQVDHLHDDHGSRELHKDTRRRTLHLAQHIWQQGEDVRFSSTILYVRILVTTFLNLKRTHHSGENEGKEGLVRLTSSHQQSL